MTALPEKLSSVLARYPHTERELAFVEKAYLFAKKAHTGQKRMSGEEYIIHPVAVATTLAQMGLDTTTIAASLLHDVLEDTKATRHELEADFGEEIAFLVDGVTKLESIRYTRNPNLKQKIDPQVSSLKKMFFAMAEDIRVILIKLADRYHNMETLKYLDAASQHRIALETIEIYGPIAARLGMGHLKGELEDLAFPFAYPAEYRELMHLVKSKYADRLKYIERTKPVVVRLLMDAGIKVVDAHARAKHYWSLYQKISKFEIGDVEKMFDLVAMRVIVPDIRSCYEALGVIHKHYKPIPGRIKDYIALPKPNGYRSLHTTVFCEKGRVAEIQIRTPDMHDHAENGIAAHWAYSESGKPRKGATLNAQEVQWVAQLKNYLQGMRSRESWKSLKVDFFKSRIFVLTPKGDVKDLPESACPIDFAYTIHSALGNGITGAKVNGKLVQLDYELKNGDVVEIVKAKNGRPRLDWLNFVKTAEAKKHIRSWFRANDPTIAIADGKNLLNKELIPFRASAERLNREQINTLLKLYSAKTMDALLGRVSMGDLNPSDVARALFKNAPVAEKLPKKFTGKKKSPMARTTDSVIIQGQTGMLYKLGKCCNPVRGQNISGYITRTKGVTVHMSDCANIRNAEEKRVLSAEWQ